MVFTASSPQLMRRRRSYLGLPSTRGVSRSSSEEFHQDRCEGLWVNFVSLAVQRAQLDDWDRLTQRLGRLEHERRTVASKARHPPDE
jgi:hypothetical protein